MWGIKLMQNGCAMNYNDILYIAFYTVLTHYRSAIIIIKTMNNRHFSIVFTSGCDINTEAQ